MTHQTVPVIDMSPLSGRAGSCKETIDQIGEACREWGFFHITGYDLSEGLIDRVWRETENFFALPIDVKSSISRSRENARGWFNRELTKNTRDMKEVFDFGVIPYRDLSDQNPVNRTRDGFNLWPDETVCPGFKSTMWEYFYGCERVAFTLLDALGESLGVSGNSLTCGFLKNHSSFLRLNYFPKHDPLHTEHRASATGHLGIHHHTDAGALTLLLQDDVGGLQIWNHDQWVPITPMEGSLVVNIGDIVQVWSNDLYRAPLHRVLASQNRDRYSLPFFYNPSYDAVYAPLEAVINESNPANYRPINWGEFRWRRQQGDFADYGQENQISDYRISRGEGA